MDSSRTDVGVLMRLAVGYATTMNLLRAAVFFLLVFPAAAYAAGPLRTVIVFGNEKTERQTILDLVGLEARTYITPKIIREVDDRLMNSGLFKEVKVFEAPNRDGTVDLRVVVFEKQLWFVFPVFQAWSGRYSGGAAFAESNLMVPAGRTAVLIQGGNKGYRAFVGFDAKTVFNSSFVVSVWGAGKKDSVPIYSGRDPADEIVIHDAVFGLRPGYQWTHDIRTSVLFRYRYVDYGTSALVAESGLDGHDVSIGFEFLFDSLRRREAFMRGRRILASYEFAETRFGTDFSYHVQEVSWREAHRFGRRWNYILDLQGTIADESLPFHHHLTLGGSSLRGYKDRQFRGDTRIVARQNLLFRLFEARRFSVFGDLFYDMGLLYFDRLGISRASFRNGVGGGFRVSLADILAPVLGVDFAYGIEDKQFQAYLALGLVEF